MKILKYIGTALLVIALFVIGFLLDALDTFLTGFFFGQGFKL